MDVQTLTYLIVGSTFFLYIGIAIWTRAGSTKDFYVAGGGVPPLANGMATAADWMSAASFISMAGVISFLGRDGAVYLMGWTGGYVLLALLLAPYLRKFGKFTVPDFVGERYYSGFARFIALLCAIFISFTYVAGQMRGVGVVFSRFLEVPIEGGVVIGMIIVFSYAVMGGMKGITYTQVAQYCVLIFAFMVPAIFISLMLTGVPVPQLGLLSDMKGMEGVSLLTRLDGLSTELGFEAYTSGHKPMVDVFFITMALMVGTAGLPHVIIRFFTVPKVRDARLSAGYALLFIAILYTTAPAIAAFARVNLLTQIPNKQYVAENPEEGVPEWMKQWEEIKLVGWLDKNNDGVVQYGPGKAFNGKLDFQREAETGDEDGGVFGLLKSWFVVSDETFPRGPVGQMQVINEPTDNSNELYVDRDIMVLANPEIAGLPNWVIALVAAGGLAAALSTAAGLLLVISTSIAHDLIKKTLAPNISEVAELWWARIAAGVAIFVAGHFGVNPPGFVAEVVAFAFGLAASSFFPAILLGIFYKRMNREGAMTGMVAGIGFTTGYIVYFKFLHPELNSVENWLFGISPEGIGSLGMIINFALALIVCRFTPPPPREVMDMVESIRIPRGAGEAHQTHL
jgi:cation/acetate symporter